MDKKMKEALQIIEVWAEYYGKNFYSIQNIDHIENYKHIAKACREALRE